MDEMLKQIEERLVEIVRSAVESEIDSYGLATSSDLESMHSDINYSFRELKDSFKEIYKDFRQKLTVMSSWISHSIAH